MFSRIDLQKFNCIFLKRCIVDSRMLVYILCNGLHIVFCLLHVEMVIFKRLPSFFTAARFVFYKPVTLL